MNLTYLPLNRRALTKLHDELIEYYRTPDETDEALEGFVQTLFTLVRNGKILGNLIQSGDEAVGFVLYAADSRESDFSELPGHGTILAMQVQEALRRQGIGSQIVRHVENELRGKVAGFYVCSVGTSQPFWEACGYRESQEKATTGEVLFLKEK
ncbi:MAG: GNAT family N-acetyltransferase [Ruminococcaceae bacterium]|nr:GNAT family N-acetyltransferase [Oscillospiraceae bacterium]